MVDDNESPVQCNKQIFHHSLNWVEIAQTMKKEVLTSRDATYTLPASGMGTRDSIRSHGFLFRCYVHLLGSFLVVLLLAHTISSPGTFGSTC